MSFFSRQHGHLKAQEQVAPNSDGPVGQVGFFIADIQGQVLDANDAFLRMVQRTVADLFECNLSCQDFISATAWSQMVQLLDDLESKGYVAPFELDFCRYDGSIFNGLVSITPMRTGTGQWACWIHEIARKPQQTIPESIFYEMQDRVVAVDMQLRYTAFNLAYALEIKKMTGIDLQIADSVETIWACNPKYQKRSLEWWRRALAGESFVVNDEIEAEQGNLRCYEISFAPLKDGFQLVGAYQIIRDITGIRQLEKMVKASEQQFHTIFSTTFQFTGMFSVDGIITEVNEPALQFGGLTREDVIGKPAWEAYWWTISPETQERLKEAIRLAGQGKFVRYDVDLFGANARVTTVDFSLKPMWDESGNIIGLIAEGRDITEQKKADLEIRRLNQQLENRLDVTFENAAVGFSEVDAAGKLMNVNQKFCEITGYSTEELLGQSIAFITYPEDQPRDKEHHRQIFNRKIDSFSYEKRYIHKNGSIIWVQLTVSAVSKAHEGIEYALAAVADITARKQIEFALRESELRFRTIADASPALIFDRAPDGHLRFLNKTGFDFFGLDQEALLLNDGFINQVHPDDQERVKCAMAYALQNTTLYTEELRLKKNDGQYYWFLATGSPSFYPNGEFYGIVGISVDITRMKQTEFALRESEERFSTVANASPAHIFEVDPKGNLRFINKTAIEYFGFGEDTSYLKEGYFDRIHVEDQEHLYQSIFQAIETKTMFKAELRLLRHDGQYCWFLAAGAPSLYPNGEVYGLIGIAVDITEMKQLSLAIRESEERFRILANSSPAQIFDLAPDGGSRFISQAAIDFLGTDGTQLIMEGKWSDIVHPDDREALQKVVEQALTTGKPYSLENRARYHSGEYRWVISSGIPSFYPNGELYGLVGTIIDITERKQAEFELQESETRWRELANAVPLITLVANAEGVLTFLNDRWYQYTGQSKEQSWGSGTLEVLHPDDRELATLVWRENIQKQELFEMELRYRNTSGSYRWHMVRVVPIKDMNGRVLNWYGSILDIHDRRVIEQELEKAKDVAEEASRKKSQFLANMSHELRTPLNAVIGFSEMLKKGMAGPLNEKQDGYLQHISTSGRHLLAMVNDILDISKAEVGRIEVSMVYVELEPLLQQIKEVVSFISDKNEVQLYFELSPEIPGLVADPNRLKQIFLNLISNAIKFNKRGGRVDVLIHRSPDEQWIVCKVQDNGIGIPQDKIGYLFSEFYQVDSSYTRPYEGTGLGLALTKKLIELHHGLIFVESEEGIGSTFTFQLPINVYARQVLSSTSSDQAVNISAPPA